MHPQLDLQIHCDRAHKHLAAAMQAVEAAAKMVDDRNILPGIAITSIAQAIECVQAIKPVPTTLSPSLPATK